MIIRIVSQETVDQLETLGFRCEYRDNKFLYLAKEWFREIQGIHIEMLYKPNIKKWDYIPYKLSLTGREYVEHYKKYFQTCINRRFNTYEDALEEALLEVKRNLN